MNACIRKDENKADGAHEVAAAHRPSAVRRAFLATLLSGAVFAVVPGQSYRTEAIVAVGDAATPLRAAMAQAAARAAVSAPVVSQAAASLIDAHLAVPTPGWFEKLSVFARLDAATGRDARLADLLHAAVTAAPGQTPGLVSIVADWPDAAAAARIATAVAEALVAHEEADAAGARLHRQVEAAQRLEGLRAEAAAARKTFSALGGTDLDPARTTAQAAAQVAAAQGRVDVVRAILASGSPPVSERRDLPDHVAALQNAYLDQTQKLAGARETYGERHTVVIALTEGVKRAASALTAEWRRLAKVADAELAEARARESASRKAVSPSDGAKRAAIETARLAVLAADDALAAAERTHGETPSETASARLLAAAPIPGLASGLSLAARLALAGLAGLAAFLAARMWSARRGDAPVEIDDDRATPSVPAPRAEPAFFTTPTQSEAPEASPPTPVVAPRPAPVAAPRRVSPPASRPAPRRPAVAAREACAITRESADAILDALGPAVPEGDVATLLLSTLGERRETTRAALALADAAAERGLRVLVVEPAEAQESLAAHAELQADPILVDLFGTLRVALAAEGREGMVHVVPALRRGTLAATLARETDVPLLDDLASDFDLVVVDGGRTQECGSLAALAHGVVRVARRAEDGDDAQFGALLGLDESADLGTLASSVFVPRPTAPAPSAVVHSFADARARLKPTVRPRPSTQPRRRAVARSN